MRGIAWAMVVMAAICACGGNAASTGEATATVSRATGEGFWCAGPRCFRTKLACNTVRKRDGIPGECVRSANAICFVAEDRDNMHSRTVCSLDFAHCNSMRNSYQAKYDYLEIAACRRLQ